MQGHVFSDPGGGRSLKSSFAEELLILERIDVLVLTETHSVNPTFSKKVTLLAHTDLSDRRAGVAFISRADSGWSCDDSRVLVPGYAMLVKLHHRRSTESVWLLGVYGNNSSVDGAPSTVRKSLVSFYRSLKLSLSVAISTIPGWSSCFAAGDWNFVSHPADRSHPSSEPVPKYVIRDFAVILELCSMKDTAGLYAFPAGWTHRRPHRTRPGLVVYSRLDRIYCPSESWFPDVPVSLPTLWSDHSLVWADCRLLRPRVQMAVPADRLPSIPSLDAVFWSSVLSSYTALVAAPVTLPRWAGFKRSVLALGTSSKTRLSLAKGRNWLAAFRGGQLSPEELDSALSWLHHKPASRSLRDWRRVWPSAVPEWDLPPPVARLSWMPTAENPWASSTAVKLVYSAPSPAVALPAPPACLPGVIEKAILRRMLARQRAARRKLDHMTTHHTSDWYNLSSNKEADERGSRASISVDGLRLSERHRATPVLGEMVQIARKYFYDLHTPEPPSVSRSLAQDALLEEVSAAYSRLPRPVDVPSGPFSLAETPALTAAMHNTAPGPDGIPFAFWKSLASKIKSHNDLHPNSSIPSFWSSFVALANDVRANGSSRCGFKDANISMFFKKGDPTLSKNYRPISSMNTDCKLYTNLVNNRLSPWAVSLLHDDQKGFVPGRHITDHTRLAYEVAHLADITGSKGFLVSLDQAKAYDRVDQSWLLRVLSRMGVDPDLCASIGDIVRGCRSRVRINGGYSSCFSLRRGVRQGDPLSCLLFNFSIEPLAMRLRSKLSGFSVHGLPPVRVMFYADDVNMFLSLCDSVQEVTECLDSTSFTIGSRFNHDKTDVKPLGSSGFVQRCFDSQTLDGHVLPGSYVLAPSAPIRVLGVWVASHDRASDRWSQLYDHISRLIRQWVAIGASLPNRVLLAKALLMSRCYYLLDGNSAPPLILRRISQMILGFVRGPFSNAPYSLLQSSLADGGLNCPSLEVRKVAYDLKFLGDLISGPADAPWRVWTKHDLALSTFSNSALHAPHLDPLLQRGHTQLSSMSDRLRDAFLSARRVGLDLRGAFPPLPVALSMPLYHHPALDKRAFRHYICPGLPSHGVSSFDALISVLVTDAPSVGCLACDALLVELSARVFADPTDRFILDELSRPKPYVRRGAYPGRRQCPGPSVHGVSLASHLVSPPPSASSCPSCVRSMAALLDKLGDTPWSPAVAPRPPSSLVIWPTASSPYDCLRVFSAPLSMLATHYHMKQVGSKFSMAPYAPHSVATSVLHPPPLPLPVHVWTDGSALDNGLESCSAGAAWISASYISDSARLTGVPLTNNVAEVSAVILALLSWPACSLHVHTDSSFVLHLVNGGLLSLERNGWPSFPWLGCYTGPSPVSLSSIFQYLLFLLRSHDGPLSFSKAVSHSGDAFNNAADLLANDGRLRGRAFSLDSLRVPPGWVDLPPVLGHQSLSFLTSCSVRFLVRPSILSPKLSPMAAKWAVFFRRTFDADLDLGLYIPLLWKLCAPPGLGELLWKSLFGALPLGRSWHSRRSLGLDFCPCGRQVPLDLFHVFLGCRYFPVTRLYSSVLWPALSDASGLSCHISVDPRRWFSLWWFPVLCLKRLAFCGTDSRQRSALHRSVRRREWIYCSFLWELWHTRMKMAHDPSYFFSVAAISASLEARFSSFPDPC